MAAPEAKDDLDLLRVVKLCAWGNVFGDEATADPDYKLRQIMRWYSREFCTPLHVVEELPLVSVLTHYFECHYEAASDSDSPATAHELEREELLLRETAAERSERVVREARDADDDDAFVKAAEAEVKRQREERERVLKAQEQGATGKKVARQPGAKRPEGAPAITPQLPQMQFPPENQLMRFDADWDLMGKDES